MQKQAKLRARVTGSEQGDCLTHDYRALSDSSKGTRAVYFHDTLVFSRIASTLNSSAQIISNLPFLNCSRLALSLAIGLQSTLPRHRLNLRHRIHPNSGTRRGKEYRQHTDGRGDLPALKGCTSFIGLRARK